MVYAMKYQDFAKMPDSKIKKLIAEQLSDHQGYRRKELLELCIAALSFTPEEIADRAPGSPVVRAKSRLGMLLSTMIANGDIEENEIGELKSVRSTRTIIKWDSVVDFLMEILRDDEPTSKRSIFEMAEKKFGTDQTPERDDDNDLHALVGQILARLEQQRIIIKYDKGYTLPPKSPYPRTELGAYLDAARRGENLKKCFLGAVHTMGGEWFEQYAVRLMEKYYERCRYTVTDAFVTGGSNDGGIDGVIETVDWIGFREKTLMQMKNKNSTIPQKDVREFYGAVCAENGSRGLFVTISKFHREAQALIDKVDNLMGITGEKLFAIAELCGFGIIEKDGKQAIDEKIFLEQ